MPEMPLCYCVYYPTDFARKHRPTPTALVICPKICAGVMNNPALGITKSSARSLSRESTLHIYDQRVYKTPPAWLKTLECRFYRKGCRKAQRAAFLPNKSSLKPSTAALLDA